MYSEIKLLFAHLQVFQQTFVSGSPMHVLGMKVKQRESVIWLFLKDTKKKQYCRELSRELFSDTVIDSCFK